MSDAGLFVLSVGVYALLPMLILFAGSFRHALLYTHIAATLVLGGFLGAAYSLQVTDTISVGAGQVLYGALMFSTLVTVLVGRDLRAVRTVVSLVVSVNVLVSCTFYISRQALRSEAPSGPGLIPAVAFDQSLRVVLSGGTLIVLELILLLAVLEFAKARLGHRLMAPVYVLTFVAVLTLDGILFPLAYLGPGSITDEIIVAGVQTKLVLASSFALPLAIFISAYRPTIHRFEATPLHLRDLILAGPAEAARRLARQEEELSLAAGREERSSATVAQILDSATNTILMALDADCRITHFNAGAQRLLGWDFEEVRGRIPEMLHEAGWWDRQAELLGVAPTPGAVIAAHADESAYRELVLQTRAGASLPVSVSTTRILGRRGQLIGYVVAGEEISSRLKLQMATLNALQRDQKSLERLREADAFKDSLISTVSHELRTPLASISGYLELLEHGDLGELSPPQLGAIETVGRNSLRLATLVDSLLTLSRAGTGPGNLRLREVDLRAVVEGLRPVIDDLAAGAPHSVVVSISLAEDPVLVHGDVPSLETVVINLVTNALKFTIGTGSVQILVDDDHGPRLVVSDTGMGIAEHEQEQLFTSFFRSTEATRREIPGTGLGLSIVAAIVEQHGGSISIDSAPGRGTTVRIDLPRRDPAPD